MKYVPKLSNATVLILIAAVLVCAGIIALPEIQNDDQPVAPHSANKQSAQTAANASRVITNPSSYSDQTVTVVGTVYQGKAGYYMTGFDNTNKVMLLDVTTNKIDMTKYADTPSKTTFPIDGRPAIDDTLIATKGRATVSGTVSTTDGKTTMVVKTFAQYRQQAPDQKK